jgi:spermidine synthase
MIRRRRGSSASRYVALLALVLFASGASALLYQIIWIKQLALVVGIVVWSQAIVQFLSARSFAFSMVLTTYLVGLLYAQRGDGVPEDRLGRRGRAGGCAVVLSHGVTLLIFTTGG